jgi:hypothetical protein
MEPDVLEAITPNHALRGSGKIAVAPRRFEKRRTQPEKMEIFTTKRKWDMNRSFSFDHRGSNMS